jgi:hypothetical protein
MMSSPCVPLIRSLPDVPTMMLSFGWSFRQGAGGGRKSASHVFCTTSVSSASSGVRASLESDSSVASSPSPSTHARIVAVPSSSSESYVAVQVPSESGASSVVQVLSGPGGASGPESTRVELLSGSLTVGDSFSKSTSMPRNGSPFWSRTVQVMS